MRETEVNIRGARVMEARARVLSATDIHAHNSFTNPRGLEPRDEKVNLAVVDNWSIGFNLLR